MSWVLLAVGILVGGEWVVSYCATGAFIGIGEGEGWVTMGGSWRVACEGCGGLGGAAMKESFMSVC